MWRGAALALEPSRHQRAADLPDAVLAERRAQLLPGGFAGGQQQYAQGVDVEPVHHAAAQPPASKDGAGAGARRASAANQPIGPESFPDFPRFRIHSVWSEGAIFRTWTRRDLTRNGRLSPCPPQHAITGWPPRRFAPRASQATFRPIG
jgi:hypothetical protein